MHAIAAGDILILVAEHVARVSLGVVVARPMQIREDERGVETEFVGVGFLGVSGVSVPQRPVVRSVGFEGEGLAVAEDVADGVLEGEVGTNAVVGTVGYAGVRRQSVGAGDAVSAEQFASPPFLVRPHAESGFEQFALQDIVIVALGVEAEEQGGIGELRFDI